MPFHRNIVVVVAHGLRSDAVSDADAWPLRTPVLEDLAGQGLRVVATSACPADAGSTVSVLTGLHARQHGFTAPTQGAVACLGWLNLLMDAGYHVAGVGCIGAVEPWLHEAVYVEPVSSHESRRCAYLEAMKDKGILTAIDMQRRQRMRSGPFEPDRLLLEPDDDIDGFIALQARAMLDRLPTDRPWALLVAFSGPGNDLPPPTLYDGLVDLEELERGFALADFRELDSLAELDFPRIQLQRLDPTRIARIRSDYLGRVSLIDHGLGRLREVLTDRSDADRTWTLVTSDRGCLLGEHGLVGHRSFLAAAVEVPIIVAPPRTVESNEVPQGLFSTVDVAPTITALCGCDSPPYWAGRSLLRWLMDADAVDLERPATCLSEFGARLMMETERHKVVFDTNTRRAIGLYDMLNDPEERENLVERATGRNILDALRWRLADALMPLRTPAGGV